MNYSGHRWSIDATMPLMTYVDTWGYREFASAELNGAYGPVWGQANIFATWLVNRGFVDHRGDGLTAAVLPPGERPGSHAAYEADLRDGANHAAALVRA